MRSGGRSLAGHTTEAEQQRGGQWSSMTPHLSLSKAREAVRTEITDRNR